ncbi:hypothetical protein [Micromonospora sp. U21]|uniref:hypothetical protein n=1 Tax=Micromonospora sp. U21 TaxID=2824899 RepID=UPI001B3951FA|nr:hypothetical protein [Micromonospora sp. U21]MBQ0905665.1 hypothetical protein [Micromonospora sp. U21]
MATRLPKVCLFCQSTSNITAEHVLPESWRKVFGASLFDRTDSGWLINSDGKRTEVEKTVKAKPFGRKVREVCGSCNNGWMSRLEEAAGPTIHDMARGTERVIARQELAHVGRWASKTAIIIEALSKMRKGSSQDQRDALRASITPPRLDVWAFPYTNGDTISYHPTCEGPILEDGTLRTYWITSIELFQVHILVLHFTEGLEVTFRNVDLISPLGEPIQNARYGLAWPPVSSSMGTPPMVRHRYVQQYLEASVMR